MANNQRRGNSGSGPNGSRGVPPARQPSQRQQQPLRQRPPIQGDGTPDRSRGSRGVPPADAFNQVKRMPPPNLPGYEDAYSAHEPRETMPPPPSVPQTTAPQRQRKRQPAPPPPQKAVNPVRRRRNRRIAAIVATVLLVAIGLGFSIGVLFKIDNYTLQGESPYSLEDIVMVFGHEEGENMFAFNPSKEAERIEQALPYVESISIRRRLPGTVVFRAEPATETYYIVQNDQILILSARRKVLRVAEQPPEGLIQIMGLQNVNPQPGLPLSVLEGDVPQQVEPSPQFWGEEPQPEAEPDPGAEGGVEGEVPQEGEPNAEEWVETDAVLEDSLQEAGEGATPVEQAEQEQAAIEEVPEQPQEQMEEMPPLEGEEPLPGEGEEEVLPEPEVVAPNQTPQEGLDALNAVLSALTEADLAGTTWIDVSDILDLRFCWEDRIVVELGTKASLEPKLKFVRKLLEEGGEISATDRGTLDVRGVPNTDRVSLRPF